MRRVCAGLAVCLALCASMPALAQAPETSPRPLARIAAAPQNGPAPRTSVSQERYDAAPANVVVAAAGLGRSLRPNLRPDGVTQKALARRQLRRKGAVCGDFDIQGDVVGTVPGKIAGCGITDAVRVRAVAGVTLSDTALMDCATARALKTWVEKGAKPAFRQHGQLAGMRVAAHYTCRTRNNQRGAKISEHGKGKAIDIAAFTMKNGKVITVLNGWGKGDGARALRTAYRAGCGAFGTTLGPGSDRYHSDHFHFDTASYRRGSYCGK